MRRLNQDAVIAIVLLLASGILFWSTFSIRAPDYGILLPSTWPRAIIIALALLSFIYLMTSLKTGSAVKDRDAASAGGSKRPPGLKGWLVYWQNPIICFALFFAYLVTLPILGSLIGGVLFVFALMSAIGGFAPKDIGLHAILSLATVGGMWSIFTFGLDVLLPTGVLFSPF